MTYRSWKFALSQLSVVLSSTFLFGFGVPTHTAISNQALDELEQSLDGPEPVLEFHDLVVSVTHDRSAYDAILAHPEYFRMGSAGPDAFPELLSGQLFAHVNQGVIQLFDGIPAVNANASFESRTPHTYRSIDFATRMLKQALSTPYRDDPRILAFALGFASHSVGDGFMHARVNELSNGFFTLTAGEGTFGKISEEVKHTSIEELLDQVLPSDLKNSDPSFNSTDRFDMRAPLEFLDDFYRQGDSFDRVGGPYYDVFLIQEEIAEAVMTAVDPLVAARSLEDLIRDALFEVLDEVTGGALGLAGANAAVEQVLEMLPHDEIADISSQLNLMRFNAEEYERQIVAYRKNLMLLSECTMRNLAQSSATEEVVDHCASADTLSRIDMNGVFDATGLFRTELEDIFLGVELESAPPRSRGWNIRRLMKYMTSSFKLDEIREAIIPIGLSDTLTLIRNFIENHREEINQAFFIVVPNLENLMILEDSAVCTANCFANDCVPRINDCIDAGEATCDEFCNRGWELAGVGVPICDSSPCVIFPNVDIPGVPNPREECNDWLGGLPWPSVCRAVSTTAHCTAEVTGAGIECAGCTVDCQYDAITKLETFDIAGTLLQVVDTYDQGMQDAKDFIIDEIIEPAACYAVLQLFREEFTNAREIIAMFDFMFDNRTPEVHPDFFAVNVAFLKEDFLEDPVYRDAVRAAATTPEQQAALDTVIGGGTLDLFTDPADDGFDGCFVFEYKDLDFTGQARALQDMTVLHTTPGPQATRLLGEFGSDFRREFLPAVNAIAGDKLVPLRNKLDIEAMFTSQGVPLSGLPWQTPGRYSAACSDAGDGSVNLLCDVVNSNDDPACFECKVLPVDPTPTHDELEFDLELRDGIHWRRSLSACASEEEKATSGKPNVTTPFTLASTDAAFEGLYSKIFRCPGERPEFTDFDEEEDIDGWTSTPNGTPTFDPDRKSDGAGSMRVCGSGFISLKSPTFDTADWNQLSNQLSIDVYAPVVTPPPYWWGAIQLQIDIPAAGLSNAWIGQIELTGAVTRGDWTTLTFTLPPAVMAALEADFPNARLQINLNVPPGGDCWGLDNLEFTGEKHFRTVFHRPGSRHLDVRTSDFLSFEVAGDWAALGTPFGQDFEFVEHGEASLGVTGAGYKVVSSRSFATSEIRAVGDQINLDLFVPDPQPNPYWVG
ncbi:MAG TPA: zinc dependent phospholipase C family protein, partial [Polyangiaceae bacterium]